MTITSAVEISRVSRQSSLDRRTFLKSAAGSAAALAIPLVITSRPRPLHAAEPAPALNRITMAGIGVGKRGYHVLRGFASFPETQVVAVCDVDRHAAGRAKAMIDEVYGQTDCALYTDFREVLARPDIDAVMIATPDHWHAIIAIEACRAGKDVFCEKPLSLTVAEGRAMVDAARAHGRVFSCGSQRVWGDYHWLHKIVRSGAIGEPRELYINVGGPSRPCRLPPQPVPDHLDWDMWLGPAPDAPYHPHRCSGAYGLGGRGWRSWHDYSGGDMTDWGAHIFGSAMFTLDRTHAGPLEVIPPDGKEHPHLTFVLDDGVRLYHAPGKYRHRLHVKGTDGEVPGKHPKPRRVSIPNYHHYDRIDGDFLRCVQTRQRPFRDVEIAHRTATICHLGNIAYQLRRPLRWDATSERFLNDPQADRLLTRAMRGPWRL